MKTFGFGHFVGIDGSEAMLKLAQDSGLYQDLRQSMLGVEPVPFPSGNVRVHCSTWVIDEYDPAGDPRLEWFIPYLIFISSLR